MNTSLSIVFQVLSMIIIDIKSQISISVYSSIFITLNLSYINEVRSLLEKKFGKSYFMRSLFDIFLIKLSLICIKNLFYNLLNCLFW